MQWEINRAFHFMIICLFAISSSITLFLFGQDSFANNELKNNHHKFNKDCFRIKQRSFVEPAFGANLYKYL